VGSSEGEIAIDSIELGWNEGLSEDIIVGIVNDSNKGQKSNKINIGRLSSQEKLMRITNTMTSSKQSSVKWKFTKIIKTP
jgi:hypothetical protein